MLKIEIEVIRDLPIIAKAKSQNTSSHLRANNLNDLLDFIREEFKIYESQFQRTSESQETDKDKH